MANKASARFIAMVFVSIILSGCGGLTVPDMHPLQSSDQIEVSEQNLILHIKCEIQRGVEDTLQRFKDDPTNRYSGYSIAWLKSWVAKINLKMAVNEKGNLTPGATIIDSSKFTYGFGARASADATRIETIGYSYNVADLIGLPRDKPCTDGALFIDGNLKISEFIQKKALLARVPNTIGSQNGSSPYTTFNYQVTFVLAYGGYFNPVWQLVELTSNTGPSLIDVGRSRTNDLTITMGPAADPAAAKAVEQAHFAAQIGQSVASALEGHRISN